MLHLLCLVRVAPVPTLADMPPVRSITRFVNEAVRAVSQQ